MNSINQHRKKLKSMIVLLTFIQHRQQNANACGHNKNQRWGDKTFCHFISLLCCFCNKCCSFKFNLKFKFKTAALGYFSLNISVCQRMCEWVCVCVSWYVIVRKAFELSWCHSYKNSKISAIDMTNGFTTRET